MSEDLFSKNINEVESNVNTTGQIYRACKGGWYKTISVQFLQQFSKYHVINMST